tara:strand:+ start:75063 stop:75737 length:675 start_codon:yes stop_codon:yes gene_type:complete
MDQDTLSALKVEILIPQPDYADAKVHSKKIDDQLGLSCDQIEDVLFEENKDSLFLSDAKEFWYGLEIQSLQTPYSEVVEMIQYVKPKCGDTWVDLGAGYGRMGMTLGFVQPEVKFIGYEFVQSRVDEGNRILQEWDLKNAVMKQADIASDDFQLDVADLYFLYDFGSKADIYKVLEKLRVLAQDRSIQVVARGRGVRSWIFMDCPWLSEINSPVQFKNWTFFKS